MITRRMDQAWLDRHPEALTIDGKILAQTTTSNQWELLPERVDPYCRLLPPEAFPANGPGPVPRSPPPWDHPAVSMVMTSRTAGMAHSPTARDLYDGMRAEHPNEVQRTAVSTWLCEATNSEIILALFQGRVLNTRPRTSAPRTRMGKLEVRSEPSAQPILHPGLERLSNRRRSLARWKMKDRWRAWYCPRQRDEVWARTHAIVERRFGPPDGAPPGFAIGGGTILAARWNHRKSDDIDVKVTVTGLLQEILTNPPVLEALDAELARAGFEQKTLSQPLQIVYTLGSGPDAPSLDLFESSLSPIEPTNWAQIHDQRVATSAATCSTSPSAR